MRLGHREERSESIQVQTLDADSGLRGHTLSDATFPSEIAIPWGVLDSDKCSAQSRHDADARNDRFTSDPIVPYAQIAVIKGIHFKWLNATRDIGARWQRGESVADVPRIPAMQNPGSSSRHALELAGATAAQVGCRGTPAAAFVGQFLVLN